MVVLWRFCAWVSDCPWSIFDIYVKASEVRCVEMTLECGMNERKKRRGENRDKRKEKKRKRKREKRKEKRERGRK